MNTPYALFDPASAYNALRSTLLTQEKIRGYFYWRKTRRARGEEQPGPSPDRPPLVLRGGAPPVVLKADVAIPQSEPLPDRYTIEVTLREPAGVPDGTPCRAFLVEQPIIDRLRAKAAPVALCREGNRLTVRGLAVWDVRASLTIEAGVLAAAIVNDKQVAVLTLAGEVQLWETAGEKAITLVEPQPEKIPCRLAVSPDGRIAWGNQAGEVFVLDPAGGKRLVQQHAAPVTGLAALPDGQWVSAHQDGVLAAADKHYRTPNADPIGTVAVAAQGRVAFNVAGGMVRLWTPGDEEADALPVLASALTSLPDGRVATAGPNGLTLWDIEKNNWRVLSDAPARAVVAAPGPRLIKLTEDDSVWVWNLQTGQDRLLQPYTAESGFIEVLAGRSMRPALAEKDDVALAQLLDHRLLCDEFPVQQAVSALPELEGRLTGNRIVLTAAIPAGSPNISENARVVVVIDSPASRPHGLAAGQRE